MPSGHGIMAPCILPVEQPRILDLVSELRCRLKRVIFWLLQGSLRCNQGYQDADGITQGLCTVTEVCHSSWILRRENKLLTQSSFKKLHPRLQGVMAPIETENALVAC